MIGLVYHITSEDMSAMVQLYTVSQLPLLVTRPCSEKVGNIGELIMIQATALQDTILCCTLLLGIFDHIPIFLTS